jgi:tetratricopeptide (TPR) repeat protein
MRNPVREKDIKKDFGGNAWHKRRRRGKSPTGSRDGRMTERIEQLVNAKRWKEARSLIQEQLIFAPTDHWLWMTLGLTYYEDKDYEKALACSRRAVELEPNCPLALWHYAGSLYMSGEDSSALAIWTVLLHLDLEEIA